MRDVCELIDTLELNESLCVKLENIENKDVIITNNDEPLAIVIDYKRWCALQCLIKICQSYCQ